MHVHTFHPYMYVICKVRHSPAFQMNANHLKRLFRAVTFNSPSYSLPSPLICCVILKDNKARWLQDSGTKQTEAEGTRLWWPNASKSVSSGDETGGLASRCSVHGSQPGVQSMALSLSNRLMKLRANGIFQDFWTSKILIY